MNDKCLLLIDFEEEWQNRDSKYYLGDFSDRLKNARRLLDAFREKDLMVIFTKHITPDSKTSFVPGSKNVKIIEYLKPLNKEKVIIKNKISPFFKTDLEEHLRQNHITELFICGIMTNLCVRSAVSDAYDRDFKIVLIKDACVSDSEATDKFTFKDIKMTRPEVDILTTSRAIKLLKNGANQTKNF
ncbi:MAG: isochorismatase family cysteine hydrolase [Thermoplasmata archaeon]